MKKLSTRSQAATEFLIVLGLAVFFFTIFFLVINQNVSEKYREKEEILVENLALNIQDEINLAFQSSDGYYRQFKIDETISGNPYCINITNNKIYIKTEKAAISLPVASIRTTLTKFVIFSPTVILTLILSAKGLGDAVKLNCASPAIPS